MRNQMGLRFEGCHSDLGLMVGQNHTLPAGTLGGEGSSGMLLIVVAWLVITYW